MSAKKESDKKRVIKPQAQYMKYAGLAFQLFFTFAIIIFAGKKIDAYLGNEKMYVTLVLIVITFLGMMYKIMKDLEQ